MVVGGAANERPPDPWLSGVYGLLGWLASLHMVCDRRKAKRKDPIAKYHFAKKITTTGSSSSSTVKWGIKFHGTSVWLLLASFGWQEQAGFPSKS